MARLTDANSINISTREPTISELSKELEGLKELLTFKIDAVKDTMAERQALYQERYDAQEKAIGKAAIAQDSYNVAHNDLTRKMEIQAKETMPRLEIQGMFRAVDDKINSAIHAVEERITGIQNMVMSSGGIASGSKEQRQDNRAQMSIIISISGLILVIVIAIASHLWK